MEMHDPASAINPAEEQPVVPAPESTASVEEKEVSTFETAEGIDPEEAVEDIYSSVESLESLIESAKAVLEKDGEYITADDIRRLRQQISAFHHLQRKANEAEGDADVTEDDELKSILNQIREKKAEYTAKIEAERAENLRRKEAIIAEINALAEDTDNVNRTFPRYRELQDEFNSIGDVPPTDDTSVWKRFQDAREHYSDNLKINKELRDYDFKKNHETKSLLLDEAQKLVDEEDVIIAYRRLQELHNKWRQIGPVAKEFREEIWDKFKTASTEINKRYQAYFEERKAREAENEAGKTAICEQLEALPLDTFKTFAAWDEATKLVIELQEKWRTYGYASRKMNKELFTKFRSLCDNFFASKAAYFQATRDELAKNLELKTALAERAESLKDSTDWKTATDAFVQMQKEWKTIGAVAKKHSDAVWRRFQQACDSFFEAKKAAGSDQRKEENENLKAKRALLDHLDTLNADMDREEAIAKLREVQEQWKSIGHVPFREKDKLYDAYRTKVDALREALDLRRSRDRMERFVENIGSIEGDTGKLGREREKLARTLEARRQELRTYENNLGFLSSKSKSGNSMLREFERKAERLRTDIADLEEKIKVLDSRL